MELALTTIFSNGELRFNNKALQVATKKIATKITQCKAAFVAAGEELARINEEKLYEQDYKTFSDYVECVLGISKSKAYSIIATSKKLLLPELKKDSEEEAFFTNFKESALTTLAGAGNNYEEIKEFCDRHDIGEMTPVSEIRAAMKEEKEALEEAATAGEENEAEIEVEAKPMKATEKLERLQTIVRAFAGLYHGASDEIKSSIAEPMKEIIETFIANSAEYL